MRIKYNLKNKNFRCYNEASGVVLLKKKLKKKPHKKVRTYLSRIFIYGICAMAISFASIIGARILNISPLINITELIFIYVLVIFAFSILSLLFSFLSTSRSNKLEGTISILKKGIVDNTSDGSKLELSYDSVELVAVTKNAIVFVLNTPFMIYIDNKDKDKVIRALQKYSDILIIDGKD